MSIRPATADGVCNQSTKAAGEACAQQTEANYQLALGMCDNSSSSNTRAKCLAQATADKRSATKLCRAQTAARTMVCQLLGQPPYDPAIDPANFSTDITNPLLPMLPGTVFTYSVPNGTNIVEVTSQTRTILGVPCVVVHDTVAVGGKVRENTYDYFAQDKVGNVWYFGEATTQLDKNGLVTGVVGSWLGGVNGAKPGIVMKARLKIGDAYRQEFLLGTAEDFAMVVAKNQKVSVPYGMFVNARKTEETSGLEPGAKENKFYVAGVGNVLVVDLVSGERDELLTITHK
jgi:hypothetical protein